MDNLMESDMLGPQPIKTNLNTSADEESVSSALAANRNQAVDREESSDQVETIVALESTSHSDAEPNAEPDADRGPDHNPQLDPSRNHNHDHSHDHDHQLEGTHEQNHADDTGHVLHNTDDQGALETVETVEPIGTRAVSSHEGVSEDPRHLPIHTTQNGLNATDEGTASSHPGPSHSTLDATGLQNGVPPVTSTRGKGLLSVGKDKCLCESFSSMPGLCKMVEDEYGPDHYMYEYFATLPKEGVKEAFHGINVRARWLFHMGIRPEQVGGLKKPKIRWTHFEPRCWTITETDREQREDNRKRNFLRGMIKEGAPRRRRIKPLVARKEWDLPEDFVLLQKPPKGEESNRMTLSVPSQKFEHLRKSLASGSPTAWADKKGKGAMRHNMGPAETLLSFAGGNEAVSNDKKRQFQSLEQTEAEADTESELEKKLRLMKDKVKEIEAQIAQEAENKKRQQAKSLRF